MNTGNSQSKSNTSKNNIPEIAKEADSEAILNNYIEKAKATLNERYRALMEQKSNTTSIADRYDLLIAIDEVKTIYKLLF